MGGLSLSRTEQLAITVPHAEWMQELFGSQDEHAKLINEAFNVEMVARQGTVLLLGERKNLEEAVRVVEGLLKEKMKSEPINAHKVSYLISLMKDNQVESMETFVGETVYMTAKGKMIKSKTLGQAAYVHMMGKKT